jgi:hypothetical protein
LNNFYFSKRKKIICQSKQHNFCLQSIVDLKSLRMNK